MRGIALACLLVLAAAAYPAASQDERFGALIGLARVKRDAGDLASARHYFDAAHRVRPLQGSERLEYFWVLLEDDPRAAIRFGHDLLRAASDRGDVRDALIGVAVRLGDEATVVALAAEGRRVDAGTARWPRRLGESYLRAKRPAMAAAAYAQAIEAADADPRDRVGLALALEAAGDRRGAAAAWRDVPDRITRENPEWVRSRSRATAAPTPSLAAAPVRRPVDRRMAADLPTRTDPPPATLPDPGVLRGDPLPDRPSFDAHRVEALRRTADAMIRPLEIAEARTRASERWAAGDHEAAITAANRVTSLVPDDGDAWFVKIAATASSRSRDELLSTIQTFVDGGVENPGLLIGLAEHLSGLVRSPDDPLIEASLSLLDGVHTDADVRVPVARARVLAAADRWTESLAQIDQALVIDAESRTALRLRADVLSWAGRHDEAILAYERYFAITTATPTPAGSMHAFLAGAAVTRRPSVPTPHSSRPDRTTRRWAPRRPPNARSSRGGGAQPWRHTGRGSPSNPAPRKRASNLPRRSGRRETRYRQTRSSRCSKPTTVTALPHPPASAQISTGGPRSDSSGSAEVRTAMGVHGCWISRSMAACLGLPWATPAARNSRWRADA